MKEIKSDNLEPYIKASGLDEVKFNECYSQRLTEKEVDADIAFGKTYGIKGTPGFLIDGKLTMGAKSYEEMRRIIFTDKTILDK